MSVPRLRSGGNGQVGGDARDEGIEVVGGQAQLCVGGLGAVDHRAERGVLGAIPGVPAQMLAGDAHTGRFAVEIVQVAQVAEQDVANLRGPGLGQAFAGAQVMGDFAEDPRPALGGAPDHPMTLEFPEGEYLKGLVVMRKG